MLTEAQRIEREALVYTMQRVVNERKPFHINSVDYCMIAYHDRWAQNEITRFDEEFISAMLGLPAKTCIDVFHLGPWYNYDDEANDENAEHHLARLLDTFDEYKEGI